MSRRSIGRNAGMINQTSIASKTIISNEEEITQDMFGRKRP
jgi:hypothetical protein